MPRAIVMIRPIASKNKERENDIEGQLRELVLNEDFLQETSVVVEYYMRVFGWPDFVVSLYGPSENLLKYAILQLRKKCGSLMTSSIIGICPEDPYFRSVEFRSSNVKSLMNKFEDQCKTMDSHNALAKCMSLETAKEYVVLHRALLDVFDRLIDLQTKTRPYKSAIEKNPKILELILQKIFINRKNISVEEIQKILERILKT